MKTASGATAVQVVWSRRGGYAQVEHLGSAHDEVELTALRRAAQTRMHEGEVPLDLGLAAPTRSAPFRVVSSRSARLIDAVESGWSALGFDHVVDDKVFRLEVLARLVEPTSKRDSLRVLAELGVDWVPSYRTVKRCLVRVDQRGYRARLEAACVAHCGLQEFMFCLYDVTTLYWETDEADGFRKPGYSKERRLEPQILVGLLTDPAGFPLMARAFEGNKAETTTIAPVLDEFRAAHPGVGVTVVADAGMMSESNLVALERGGYRFIIGGRLPKVPAEVAVWREAHPGEQLADGQVFCSPRPATTRHARQWTVFYQYRAERARRNLHGIDESVRKAHKIIDGAASAKKNRFLKESGATRQIDQALVESARARAGIRSYTTNLDDPDPDHVISAYHQLWHVENTFRMSKHDLRARPAFHHMRERIEAHLTIVFAALAIGRWIETVTGVTLRFFLHTLRPIRQVVLDIAGTHVLGEDPLTADATTILTAIDNMTRH